MKKSKIFAAFLTTACLFALTFTGCNFLQNSNDKSDIAESETSTAKTYSSIEEYLKNPLTQVTVSTIKNAVDETTTINVKAEDNKLVFEYTYADIYEKSALSGMAYQLKTSYERNASVYTSLASSIEKEVDVENPLVVIRYLNGDKTVIYEGKFAPDADTE